MNITQATYLRPPSKGLRIIADGLPAIIKPTRKSLLDRGVAVLADTRDAQFPWVNNLAYHLDGDETNVEASNKIVGGTDDPVIVCLARRYWHAVHDGTFRSGPVEIPTAQEARYELGNFAIWLKDDPTYALAA